MREDPALRETRECIFLRFSAKIPPGIGFRTWSLDNGDQYPMNVPAVNGGALSVFGKTAQTPQTQTPNPTLMYTIYGCMSNEISTPKLCICPADYISKSTATSFSSSS